MEIANKGNLTKAAISLNMSQPAISAHIKALEEEVGFSLFQRVPRGMKLTEQGEQLLEEGKKILESVDHFSNKVDVLNNDLREKIKIGLNSDGELLRIKEIIESVEKEMPTTELHFIKTRSEDFIADIECAKIDAGFFYGNYVNPSIKTVKLCAIEMVVVYPSNWEVDFSDLSVASFKDQSWIWTTQGCPFYKASMDYFESEGIMPRKVIHVDDELLVGELVKDGIGCSLLAEPIARRFVEDGKLKIWKDVHFTIDLYFGFLEEGPHASALMDLCVLLESVWHK